MFNESVPNSYLNPFEKMNQIFQKLGKKDYQMEMDEFIGKNPKFTKEKIESDKLKLANVEKKFDEKETRESVVLEKILIEQIELADWLGPNSQTFETTKYDDVFNHTDFVLNIRYKNKNHYFAIDATVSESDQIYLKKYNKIYNELKQKKGTKIEYYMSESGVAKGLDNIPSIVIGMDKGSLRDLGEIVHDKLFQKGDLRKKANDELAHSSIQITIIKDMVHQLSDQLEFLNKTGAQSSDIANNIKDNLNALRFVLGNKKGVKIYDRPEKTPLVYNFNYSSRSGSASLM